MSQFDCCRLQLVCPTMEHRPARNLYHETGQTTFGTSDQSQDLFYILYKSFFVLQLRFYLEIIKHIILKMWLFFPSVFNIKMASEKFSSFGKLFKMHTDMTTVTIQCNKTVLNEVKDTEALLEPFYRKTKLFGQANSLF